MTNRIDIDGWYTVNGPLTNAAGEENKTLLVNEVVVAKTISDKGDVFVRGLESRNYGWLAASSLARIPGAPGEWK